MSRSSRGNELAVAAGNRPAAVAGPRFAAMPPETRDLIRRVLVPAGASDDEVEFALEYARARGLNPMSGQVYFVRYRTKDANDRWTDALTPVTGVAGWRTIADRTGLYEGSGAPEWLDHSGKWVDVWIAPDADRAAPLACRVEVYRRGFRVPVVQPVRFAEFAQRKRDGTLRQLWAEKPSYMLAIRAEVASLRKAFPDEFANAGEFLDPDAIDSDADVIDVPTLPPEVDSPRGLEPGETVDVDTGEVHAGSSEEAPPASQDGEDPIADAAERALAERRERAGGTSSSGAKSGTAPARDPEAERRESLAERMAAAEERSREEAAQAGESAQESAEEPPHEPLEGEGTLPGMGGPEAPPAPDPHT